LFRKNVEDWKELDKRKYHPNVTIFSSLSLEDKIKIINQGDASNRESEKEKREEEDRLKAEK
jgi:4-diphosphocytidyl-2C-methyl-D-erythritol kinase